MKLSNPLEMNDWRIRSFVLFSLVMLALLWTTSLLSASGFSSPLLQPAVGCVCLLYLPGIAVLRVMRLHALGSVETSLYAVGVSIVLTMLTGVLVNVLLPLVGINDPLSASRLILAYSALLVGLCVACYVRDRDYAAPTRLHVSTPSPGVVCLLLLPFASIFGTYLVNAYDINGLIPLLLICIGAVVIIVTARSAAIESRYPLVVFSLSLSLLLSNSLISRYLWGWDIFGETNVANVVATSAIWNPTYATNYGSHLGLNVAKYNSVMSVSILAPVLMKVCNIDATTLFKVVYPSIYALVPVALYQLFRRQMSDTPAFLASFYFVAVPTFSVEMLSLAREEIAQLFLVLVLLTLFNKTFHKRTRASLLVLFAGAMIVSHYGTAYLFVGELILVYPLLLVMDRGVRGTITSLRGLTFWKARGAPRPPSASPRRGGIALLFVVLCLVLVLVWNTYTGGTSMLPILRNMLTNTFATGVPSLASTQALARTYTSGTPLMFITSRLNALATLLILLGIVAFFFKWRRAMQLDKTYVAFVVVNVGLMAAIYALPAITIEWNASRLYHLALIILAPFLVVGTIALYRTAGVIAAVRREHASQTNGNLTHKAYVVSAVLLAVLVVFNTGVVFAAAKEPTVSPSLFHNDLQIFVQTRDIAGANWMTSSGGNSSVWVDYYGASILAAYSRYPMGRIQDLALGARPNATDLIYVRAFDVATTESDGGVYPLLANGKLPRNNETVMYSQHFVGNCSKLYDSGCAVYGP